MTGKTHMLFGSVASLYLLPKLGYEPTLITTASALLGSLLPDIDHPKAKINQKILPMKNKLGKILFYCGLGSFFLYRYKLTHPLLFIVGVLFIIIGLSQHRSFTHSILGILILSAVTFFVFKNKLSYPVILSFIIGLISHLIGDWMTIGGIRLFYPLTHKKYRFILTISSGNLAEPIICAFLIYFIIKFYMNNGFYIGFVSNGFSL